LPDAPTPWELQRALAAIREDMREHFKSLNQRLDRNVSVELFNAFQEAMQAKFADAEKDIAEIKAARDAEARQRAERSAQDRRLIFTAVFTAVLAPLALLLLNLYLTSKGGK
jgi:hypothetical protein